jgi:hypothetical protein
VETRITRLLSRIEEPTADTAGQDKLNAINELIDRKLIEVEELAESGRINESEALMKEIEKLKENRDNSAREMVCEI